MRFLSALLLSVGLVLPAGAQTGFLNFQAARGVIGQPIFAGGVINISQSTTGGVQGVAATSNRIFVADSNILSVLPLNNRVLIFDSTQIPAPHADLSGLQPPPLSTPIRCVLCNFSAINVLGEPDYVTPNPGPGIAPTVVPPTQNNMYAPTGVASDGTILVVADTFYNRVLIWKTIPTTINASPDIVLGQSSFTAQQPATTINASSVRGPIGVWVQNGKLFVADTANSRVLIWNTLPTTNNQPADVVLGEPNFTTRFTPVANVALKAAANTMYNPTSVTSDGTHLFVTDTGFNRVLIWNSIPTTNQQPADLEIGQPDMTSTAQNNVVNFCASNGTNTTTNTPTYPFTCEKTLSYPRFALADNTGRLFVADAGNDRVLIFKSIPTVNGAGADNVLGQPDFVSDVVTDQTSLITSTFVSNNSSANTVRAPSALAWDGTNLYVTDPYDLRVLYFTPADPSLPLPVNSVLNAASMQIHAEGFVALTGTITKGDTVTVTIAGTNYTYTVLSTDSLQSIANGLVTAINSSNSGAGDPNAIAVSVPGAATVSLNARAQGSAGNLVTLGASTSASATVIASASGNELTGGNGATLAPGTYVTINAPPNVSLSPDGGTYTSNSAPLPTSFHGVQVYFDGIPGSIAYVSPTQIRVQMPFDYSGTSTGSVYVRLNHVDGSITTSNAVNLTIVPANPGIFSMGTGTPPQAIAVHATSFASAVVSVDGTITAGNTATVTVGGRAYTHTVVASDTLNTVTADLITQINTDPQVTAAAGTTFTRIIIQARIPGPAGNGITVTTSTSASSTIILTAYNPSTCCANTAGSPVTVTNPAAANELINIFGTGLGILANGQGSPAGYPYYGPVPNSVDQANFVSATLSGATAQVVNAGFPYGSIGIYQIELQMPASLTTNNAAQLYIAQNAFISNIVTIPVTSTTGNALSISPDPIVVNSGPLVGTATITYTASVNANVYVNGTLFCGGTTSGTCTTGNWVTDGAIFTLVDPATNTTLATAIASVQRPSAILTANPNPIINDGSGLGITTILVNANTPVNVTANGTLLCGPIMSGSCLTGKWVTSGTVFAAVLPGTTTVLTTLSVPLQSPSGSISLTPNPIGVVDGSGLGTGTINFSANVPASVYVNGTLFCGPMLSGSCATGKWVSNGLVFTLVNPAAGNAALATVTAQVQAVPPSGTITIPNPIVVTDGTGLAIVNVSYSANVVADLYADGTFFCGDATSQTCVTGKWVANGTVFTLRNHSNNAMLTQVNAVVQGPTGTLAANPNPVVVTDGSGLGVTTVNFTTNVPVNVLADGTLFCSGTSPGGSCTTGKWVSNGTIFTLFSPSTNQVLSTLKVTVQNQ